MGSTGHDGATSRSPWGRSRQMPTNGETTALGWRAVITGGIRHSASLQQSAPLANYVPLVVHSKHFRVVTPERGHLKVCAPNNANSDKERTSDHATSLRRLLAVLRGRNPSTAMAACSHRWSPVRLMCDQPNGEVWASRWSGTVTPVNLRCTIARSM